MTRMARRVGFASLFALAMLLAACARQPFENVADPSQKKTFRLISPLEASRMIRTNRENRKFLLLDIRRPEEVEPGHIAGTVMLDDYSETFRDELALLDREKTYLIDCRTGNRTGKTMTIMDELGFETVYDLEGGITAWAAAGQTICVGPLDEHYLCYADPGQLEETP